MNFFKKPFIETIDYNQIRQEQLDKIAILIKEKRLELDFDQEIISNHLHIPVSILKAIESADLSHLPEPVFTQQLIRKYANYLKLNGDELTDKFPVQLTSKIKEKKYGFQGLNFSFKLNIKPQHLYLFYFLLLFFSIRNLSTILESPLFTQTKIPQKQIFETNTNPPTASPPVNTNPEIISIVEKQQEKPPTPEELTVKVTVKDDCWVKVSVDGKPTFEGVLNKGLQKQWVGKQKVTIRAGNAGGLLISVNGEKPQELGKVGQVQEATFELPIRS
ncbi:helix-turn-helix domain-containing protein [Geminocystis sp. NIES-3709]|uniref:helix-turn-helix domain-containing protein n=1 Tax=Geminocystis sp. NIES-3709 TaxID=1617448 RepID=UPI0005FCBB74|nr:helix-turn-helix domain-containing protein [Geminocystis sp. NIES-3709]BAQ63681.1 transcriptional regulator [Geminocystis sp. NIES-3709]